MAARHFHGSRRIKKPTYIVLYLHNLRTKRMQNTYMIIIDNDDKIPLCVTPDFVMKFTMTVMYIVP